MYVLPFLDCDTAGSEQTNQEEVRATGETVYECKDKTNNALLHETEANLQSLVHLSHARSVHDFAPNKTLHPTETRETEHGRRMRLSLHRCLSVRHIASALLILREQRLSQARDGSQTIA